jgi:hypothetical protein
MLRATAIAGAIAGLALAASAHAAAPNYMLIHGPGLPKPILLPRWSENGAVLSTLVQAPYARPQLVRQLRSRPRLGIALFWGWSDRPRPTSPGAANQRGWFYPADGSQPAVVALRVNGIDKPRLAPPRSLRILARYGVPIRT